MKRLFWFALACPLWAQTPAPPHPIAVHPELLKVQRIYVSELSGGTTAPALRDLIIAGLNASGQFILTENPDRADATLKGSAEERSFVDIHDSSTGMSTRQSSGHSSTSGALKNRANLLGISVSDNESHHIDEHQQQAYATVRLCNKDGDVIWSTTQQSNGAKFKGAGADVADKISRQLLADFVRARQQSAAPDAH